MAAGAAYAQDNDAPDPMPEAQHSRVPPGAIVQPLEAGPGAELRRNLRTLASNPRSLDALIGAGRAAADMGDGEAALGFFARADEVSPRDARVKAGMASALVQMERPEQALVLFAEAAQLGAPEAEIAKDRGLAFDMVGDSGHAQEDYRLYLRRHEDAETERRLALSLAIGGQRGEALRVIDGQLRRHDRAAWRTQAFVLALTGDPAGAEETAGRMMPAQNAREMAYFFQRLPSLSASQKAAAVHFGRFPSDGRNLQIASNAAAVLAPVTQAPPRRVLPEPEPDTTRRRPGSLPERPVNTLIRRQEVAPPVQPSRPVQTAEAQPRRFEDSGARGDDAQPPRDGPREAPAFTPGANFTLAPGNEPVRATPPPSRPRAEPAPPRPGFSEVADFIRTLPPEEAAAAARAAGLPSPNAAPAQTPAVDRRAADAAARAAEARYRAGQQTPARTTRQAAATPAPPRARAARAAPANPSRRWVQIATGANRAALPLTYSQLRERAGTLLNNRNVYTARAQSTNRMLIGPFESDGAVRSLVTTLRARGVLAVAWTSEAGQEIDRLQIANDTRSASSSRNAPARATARATERRPAAAPARASRTGSSASSRNNAAASSRSARRPSREEPRPTTRTRRTR